MLMLLWCQMKSIISTTHSVFAMCRPQRAPLLEKLARRQVRVRHAKQTMAKAVMHIRAPCIK